MAEEIESEEESTPPPQLPARCGFVYAKRSGKTSTDILEIGNIKVEYRIVRFMLYEDKLIESDVLANIYRDLGLIVVETKEECNENNVYVPRGLLSVKTLINSVKILTECEYMLINTPIVLEENVTMFYDMIISHFTKKETNDRILSKGRIAS